MGTIDFSLSPPVAYALLWGFLAPIFVLIIARFSGLHDRNGMQFGFGCVAVVVAWIICLFSSGDGLAPAVDIVAGVMILGAVLLFYLEVWSLLSRGYTLGLLLTLLAAGGVLRTDELAHRYRGGDGLTWIMRHRLAGLIGAGLVAREGDRLTITRWRGFLITWCYRWAVAILGLRRTG